MIELQIEEIFVPIGLPFTLKELDLEIKTENKKIHIKCDFSKSIKIECSSNERFDLLLISKGEIVSKETQDFSFLKGNGRWERYDDWVSFGLNKKKNSENRQKTIKIKFSGFFFTNDKELSSFSMESDESSDEESYESTNILTSPQETTKMLDIQDTVQIFHSCRYIDTIYYIEYYYKYIIHKLNSEKVQLFKQKNDVESILNESYNSDTCEVYGSSLIDLDKTIKSNEVKSLAVIVLSICAKNQWANVLNNEIRQYKIFLDEQDTMLNKVKIAWNSIKKEFKIEIETVDDLIREINETNKDAKNVLDAKISFNETLLKKKQKLENELSNIKKNSKVSVKDYKLNEEVKDMEKQLEKSLKNRFEIAEKIKKISFESAESIKTHEKNQKLLKAEINKNFETKKQLEQEIFELQKENNRLNKEILLSSKTWSNDTESEELYKNYQKTMKKTGNKLKELEDTRLTTNRDTVLFIEKLEKSLKLTNQYKIVIEKKIEEKTSEIQKNKDLADSKELKILSNDKKKTNGFEEVLLENQLEKVLNQESDYLCYIFMNFGLYFEEILEYKSKINQKLKEKVEKKLSNKLGYELSFTSPCFDNVDELLAEFLSWHKDKNLVFIKKSYGIYFFYNKTLQLTVNNGKLVVKVGSGFLPINEFVANYRRRSPSKSSPVHCKRTLEYNQKY